MHQREKSLTSCTPSNYVILDIEINE